MQQIYSFLEIILANMTAGRVLVLYKSARYARRDKHTPAATKASAKKQGNHAKPSEIVTLFSIDFGFDSENY